MDTVVVGRATHAMLFTGQFAVFFALHPSLRLLWQVLFPAIGARSARRSSSRRCGCRSALRSASRERRQARGSPMR
jgi:hypothetical protein